MLIGWIVGGSTVAGSVPFPVIARKSSIARLTWQSHFFVDLISFGLLAKAIKI